MKNKLQLLFKKQIKVKKLPICWGSFFSLQFGTENHGKQFKKTPCRDVIKLKRKVNADVRCNWHLPNMRRPEVRRSSRWIVLKFFKPCSWLLAFCFPCFPFVIRFFLSFSISFDCFSFGLSSINLICKNKWTKWKMAMIWLEFDKNGVCTSPWPRWRQRYYADTSHKGELVLRLVYSPWGNIFLSQNSSGSEKNVRKWRIITASCGINSSEEKNTIGDGGSTAL